MSASRVVYIEHSLESIIRKWASEFKPKDPKEHVFNYDFFIDQSKGVVVFKLYVTDNPAVKPI